MHPLNTVALKIYVIGVLLKHHEDETAAVCFKPVVCIVKSTKSQVL